MQNITAILGCWGNLEESIWTSVVRGNRFCEIFIGKNKRVRVWKFELGKQELIKNLAKHLLKFQSFYFSVQCAWMEVIKPYKQPLGILQVITIALFMTHHNVFVCFEWKNKLDVQWFSLSFFFFGIVTSWLVNVVIL